MQPKQARETLDTILFRIDKTSLGVSRIGVATPWDDCPYTKSNANTFVRAHAYTQYVLCGTGYVGRYQNSGLSNGTLDITFLR